MESWQSLAPEVPIWGHGVGCRMGLGPVLVLQQGAGERLFPAQGAQCCTSLLLFVPRAADCAPGVSCSHVFLLLRLRRGDRQGVCRSMTSLKDMVTPERAEGMIHTNGER